MRVGPLANSEIIDKLNRYYVPVLAVIEDYEKGGLHQKQHVLLNSVWADARSKKLPAGVVHAFLLNGDGTVINSLHVRDAMNATKLTRFLNSNIAALATQPGNVLSPPKPVSIRPTAEKDQLLIQVQAEYTQFKKVVAEDWLVLAPSEWKQFTNNNHGAKEWTIDGQLSKKILAHVYPFSLDWNANQEQVSAATLNMKTLPSSDGKRVFGIEGILAMRHNLTLGKNPKPVMAQLIGKSTVGADGKPEIVITTMTASYDNKRFDALVRSVSD